MHKTHWVDDTEGMIVRRTKRVTRNERLEDWWDSRDDEVNDRFLSRRESGRRSKRSRKYGGGKRQHV